MAEPITPSAIPPLTDESAADLSTPAGRMDFVQKAIGEMLKFAQEEGERGLSFSRPKEIYRSAHQTLSGILNKRESGQSERPFVGKPSEQETELAELMKLLNHYFRQAENKYNALASQPQLKKWEENHKEVVAMQRKFIREHPSMPSDQLLRPLKR